MATGATEQNIVFNERYVGVRASRIMAIFACISAASYAALVSSSILGWGGTLTVISGLVVATSIGMAAGMATVLWLMNSLTRSYQATVRSTDRKA